MADATLDPEPTPESRRWYSPAPAPVLPPISTRRAYLEVLGVFAAFFAVGIIGAILLLSNKNVDPLENASWGIYGSESVDVVCQIGLAVALVFLLCERRQVSWADLGVRWPHQPDGSLAVSQTIRIFGWAYFAQVVGGILNSVLQTGHLPTNKSSAPELIFSVVDSVQAGIIEELVVLAFVVVTLRQARRPLWEITAVALVLRGSYHVYYGPGVFGILLWASLFYWIYLRFRTILPLMIAHALWDAVAFIGESAKAVAAVGFLVIVGLWIVSGILWLTERSNRSPATEQGGNYGGPNRAGSPGASWPSQSSPQWPTWQSDPASGHDSPVVSSTQPSSRWPQQAQPAIPPGWHPDPTGQNRWRWWDGTRWTDHVSRHSTGADDRPL